MCCSAIAFFFVLISYCRFYRSARMKQYSMTAQRDLFLEYLEDVMETGEKGSHTKKKAAVRDKPEEKNSSSFDFRTTVKILKLVITIELLAIIGRFQQKQTKVDKMILERGSHRIPRILRREKAMVRDCLITSDLAVKMIDHNTLDMLKEIVSQMLIGIEKGDEKSN